MGTLGEKLNYLKETKEKLYSGYMVWMRSGQTFRERIDFIVSIMEHFAAAFMPNDKKFTKTVTLADGTTADLVPDFSNCFIAPSIPLIARGNGSVSSPGWAWQIGSAIGGETFDWTIFKHIDLSAITRGNYSPGNSEACNFYFKGTPESVIFPDKVHLFNCTLRTVAKDYIFKHGVRFGSRASTNGSWIYSLTYKDANVQCESLVYVGENFKGTLWLGILNMSAETMVGIFNNLAELAETESYTIGIGSTNMAKLTEEQLNIAYAKGWDIQ